METRAQRIEQTLDQELDIQHLEVIDESANHSVPAGAQTHFKVVIVSPGFENASRIDRHRRINALLQSEFDQGMHALAIHPYTESEWRKRFGNAPMSPACAGGDGAARLES
ncbi:MAG: BolA family protein [Pseudomonadales bacterium]|jgi:BolA protein|nr:BolA family protein [Pseudomonadales bacterium]